MISQYIEINDVMNAPIQEAYRVLGANIKMGHANDDKKLIAFVSYGPEEGKTTSAVHLAITLAKSGFKVLLVDADLRKPLYYKKLSEKYPVGLLNLMENPQDIIHPTQLPNLYITTSGQSETDPLELLTSKEFDNFLANIRTGFDIVLFDTSYMGGYIDAAVLSSKMDGTVIVVKAKKTTSRRVLKLKEQLNKVNAPVLGIVLNQVPKAEFKHYYLINRNFAYLKRKIKGKHK